MPKIKEKCHICNKGMDNLELVLHYEREHSHILNDVKLEAKIIKCDLCIKTFKTPQGLRRHIKSIHHTNKECDICNKTFETPVQMRCHKRFVHEKRSVPCSICGENLSSRGNLNKHIKQVHEISDQTFKCDFCSKSFKEEYLLKDHFIIHQSNRPKFKCEKCGKQSYTLNALKMHIRGVHDQIKTDQCDICLKYFSCAGRLKDHKRNIHEKRKDFKCPYCIKSFSQKNNLSVHVEIMHTKKSGRGQCDVCWKIMYKGRLKKHKMHVHDKVRKFQCNVCNKGFIDLRDRERHILTIHENIRNFKCESCDKAFKRVHHLKGHVKSMHSNSEKPFSCGICNQRFSSMFNKTKHEKNTHNLEGNLSQPLVYACDICEAVFQSINGLKTHRRLKHEKRKKHKR